MTLPAPRHNWMIRALTTPIVRGITWLGIVIAIGVAVGQWTTPALGGLGPALFWIGIVVLPFVLTTVAVLLYLLERYPNIQHTLGSVFQACSVVAFIGLLALATLEAQYRASHPIPPMEFESKDPLIYLQRPDPVLGWRSARNYSVPMDFLSGTRRFTTNSLGFRDIQQELDPNRPRVVIIGDSFPLGWGGDVQDSITPMLRKVLPEAQIFNASWQAYSKDQIRWSYQKLARPLQPRVVVMMLMSDPFRDTSLPLYFGLRKPYNLLDGDKLIQAGTPVEFYKNAEENRAYHTEWQARRVSGPVSAWHFLTHDFIRAHSAFGRQVLTTLEWREAQRLGMPPIDAIESKIMSKLKAEVEADGAHLIVVPSPRIDIFKVMKDPIWSMQRHLDSYRKLGIDTVDITPLLVEDWSRCFNAEKHPNALAIRRLHGSLGDHIRPHLGPN